MNKWCSVLPVVFQEGKEMEHVALGSCFLRKLCAKRDIFIPKNEGNTFTYVPVVPWYRESL